MIITCPNCAMHYDVPKAFLPPKGEEVECPGCKSTWQYQSGDTLPKPDAPKRRTLPPPAPNMQSKSATQKKRKKTKSQPPAPLPDVDVKEEAKRLMHKAQRARRKFEAEQQKRAARFRGWCAYAACLALLVTGAVMFPNHVTRAIPGSSSLYEKAGLDVANAGLDLQNITTSSVVNNGTLIITVKGDVVNTVKFARDVPPIKLSIKSDDNVSVYSWQVKVDEKKLSPHGTLSFTTRLAAPPKTTGKVEIRFAALDEIG